MNKQLELDIIDYELNSLRGSKIKLMKLLGKNKKRKPEHEKILSDTLELNREQEQELLTQRTKIQETTSSGGDIGHTGVTTDNEDKI